MLASLRQFALRHTASYEERGRRKRTDEVMEVSVMMRGGGGGKEEVVEKIRRRIRRRRRGGEVGKEENERIGS